MNCFQPGLIVIPHFPRLAERGLNLMVCLDNRIVAD